MQGQLPESTPPISHLVRVRAEASGQFTAEVVGLPEIRASAATREEAVALVQRTLAEWLASGQLVVIRSAQENPLLKWFGCAKNDPLFDEYLEDIRRFRQEADAQADQEPAERPCSNSSSTPTT